jgi:D-glycero-beta-D-manno-heptose-7-phosphate kinase
VPVLLVDREETKAGGAGNVALNLVTLGMKVRLLGRVGDDTGGNLLLSMLSSEGVETSGVFQEKGFPTSTKTRVIAGSQQLLRVDKEKCSPLSSEIESKVLSSLSTLTEGVDLIAISDYAKGFLSDTILRAVIDRATTIGVPCIVDPKANDFQKYAGCTVLKPNESETLRAAPGCTSLENAALVLLDKVPMNVLMVTRSEAGISLFYPSGKTVNFPVTRKEVRDGTGAGDTVLAMISAALASKISLEEAVPLANIAASCGVEVIGCARVSLRDVAEHLFDIHHSEKIWTGESFAGMLEALYFEKLLMIKISSSALSPEKLVMLSTIAREHSDRRVIACFEEEVHDRKLLELISSLAPLRLVVHGMKLMPEVAQKSPNHLLLNL